jgi:DNA topoisomerase I
MGEAKPDSRSLESEEQLFTITLEEAEALFAQPKRRRGAQPKPPIAELGPHPETGARVRVLDGRFGPYVTDGTVNATVPRGIDPAEIDLEQGVELLREREARGLPERKPRKTAKKTAKKTSKSTSKRKSPPRTTTRVVKKGTSKRAKAATKKATAEIPVPTKPEAAEPSTLDDPLA